MGTPPAEDEGVSTNGYPPQNPEGVTSKQLAPASEEKWMALPFHPDLVKENPAGFPWR